MKRIITALLSLILTFSIICSLPACSLFGNNHNDTTQNEQPDKNGDNTDEESPGDNQGDNNEEQTPEQGNEQDPEQSEEQQPEEHIHTFDTAWSFDQTYHWHAATCGHTEEVADKSEHTVENGLCTVCNAILDGTEGLEYTLSDDGTYYSVSGIGTVTDTHIIIPSVYNNLPVTSIGMRAFSFCTSLTSIIIPDGVTSIADYAFQVCTSLTSIVIPDSVTYIGIFAFLLCASLMSITIPDNVKSIGASAFEGCASFTSIIVPDGVISIGSYAFYRCTSLTNVAIPNSVTSIGRSAFDRCFSLEAVYYAGSEEQWKEIDIGLYNDELIDAEIHYNYEG